jgi:hypothetical protein
MLLFLDRLQAMNQSNGPRFTQNKPLNSVSKKKNAEFIFHNQRDQAQIRNFELSQKYRRELI